MPTSRFRKVFVLNTDCLATTIQVSDDLKCFYSKRFQFSFFFTLFVISSLNEKFYLFSIHPKGQKA